MMRELLASVLVVSTFQTGEAFVPVSQVQGLQGQNIRSVSGRSPPNTALSNEKLLVDPIDPKNELDEPPLILDYVRENDSLLGGTVGVGDLEEIIVENLAYTQFDNTMATIEADVGKHVQSIFSDTQESSAFITGEEVLSEFGLNDIGNSTMNEDLKAVLEASSEAAAAAEASMPQDLIEQLDFSANATSSEPIKLDQIPEILSASSVVGEPITQEKIEPPNVSKILKFAVPAIGVWLCGPLLSLIDTSAVGVLSGTVQQAALNPAVAVTDYAALLIAFMYTGTTNLVAAAQESDRHTPDKPTTTKTVIGAMQISTYVGAGLGVILFAFARPLLRAIIGNDSISPAVFAAAMKYVRIRALGMPAAAIIGSTQAACLGMQDIRSPLYVLAAAAVVNFFGDVFFVGNSHPLLGGTAGAAWATVVSQYAAVMLFVRWLCHKKAAQPRVMNLSKAILEMTGKKDSEGDSRRERFRDTLRSFHLAEKASRTNKVIENFFRRKRAPQSPVTKSDGFSVRGFLEKKFTMKDLIKRPSAEIRQEFAPYLLPVTTTQVGRVSGYVAMSHVVASSLGTVSMAAQQIVVSLFYCLCPIADSLSLTAQSFLPSISEKSASLERASALRRTTKNFVKAGAVFGGAMMTAVAAIPLLTGMFTSDPAVVAMVNSVVPLLLAFFGVHGVLCASEGLLLGQKDLNFLGKMYSAFFAAVPYLMLRVKRAALTGSRAVGLTSVWKVFVGYQMFRTAAWAARILMLQRRVDKEAEGLALSP